MQSVYDLPPVLGNLLPNVILDITSNFHLKVIMCPKILLSV